MILRDRSVTRCLELEFFAHSHDEGLFGADSKLKYYFFSSYYTVGLYHTYIFKNLYYYRWDEGAVPLVVGWKIFFFITLFVSIYEYLHDVLAPQGVGRIHGIVRLYPDEGDAPSRAGEF